MARRRPCATLWLLFGRSTRGFVIGLQPNKDKCANTSISFLARRIFGIRVGSPVPCPLGLRFRLFPRLAAGAQGRRVRGELRGIVLADAGHGVENDENDDGQNADD